MLSFGEGVGGVDNDLIALRDSGGDLDGLAVVFSDGDGLQMDDAVANDADLETLGAEE
jgi:hypothetical protein